MTLWEVGRAGALVGLVGSGCQFGSPGGGAGTGDDTGDASSGDTAVDGAGTLDTSGGGDGTASASVGSDDAPVSGDDTAATGDPVATSDGSSTGPIATCADDNGGCDPLATCDDATGQIVCDCPAGYANRSMGCVVDATLETLRWDLECSGGGGCSGDYCPAPDGASDQAVLAGDPAVVFDVTLSFLGVVEQKEITGGTNDGMWNEGGTPVNDDWNVATLVVSDPDQVYYLNDGAADVTYTSLVTYQQTIPIRGGATVTLATADTNACMVWNHSPTGDPIVVPGVPPFPRAHPGQFIQADAIAIVPQR